MLHTPSGSVQASFLRRIICVLLVAIFCSASPVLKNGLSEGEVYKPEETEPFSPDAELLTIRVAGMKTGDSMLITFGDQSMLVDLGTGAGLEDVMSMLEAAGLTSVDYFCNTHPHEDHLGGFFPLVESGFPIGAMITFFDHDFGGRTVVQKRGIKAAEENNIPIIDMRTEDQMNLGDVNITVYQLPKKKYTWDLTCNDQSGMLMIRYGECSILLTGDVEIRSQAVLARLYDLKADILKVPHHGINKMELSFLENVDPKYAFITGSSNGSEVCQTQLKRKGVNHVNFSRWGMITMQTDGEKWIVWQELDPEMDVYIQRYQREHPWLII